MMLMISAGNCVLGWAQSSIEPVPVQDVSWTPTSFWGERIAACRNGSLETFSGIMNGKEHSHFVENFRIAAGLADGKHRGPAWNDGDTYKWLECLAVILAQGEEPRRRREFNEAISLIAAAQRSDGYLHTPVLILQRNSTEDHSVGALTDPTQFEMYNLGHLMSAGCAHYRLSGDRRLLDVAVKAADYLDVVFARPEAQQARHAICPAHYMGILDLYRVTSESRYLELARRWMKMRDLVQGGDDNQDRVPFAQAREAVGHAVRANYLYAGAADLYLESGEPHLLPVLQQCWDSVQSRKIYITGGCGALFDGASPDGSGRQKEITRVHQAYGRNYQLPNSTAHNETCAAVGYVLWNQRMFQITGQARYIDALENSLINAVLAGVSLDGQRFFYTNTLRQLHTMPVELRWPRRRQEWISCYCCPPNVARTVASVGRLAYAHATDCTYVLLYGANRLVTRLPDGEGLELVQRSDYPVHGRTTIEFSKTPPQRYEMRLRIPGWCQAFGVKVNGQGVESVELRHGFACLARHWKVGDRIELDLGMPVELIEAHPLVEECRGQVAVRRGPLVYCIESADLPEGGDVLRVAIKPDTRWELHVGTSGLERVPTLVGQLILIDDPPTTELYRRFEVRPSKAVQARLVPYYAWANRQEGEMTVFMKVFAAETR